MASFRSFRRVLVVLTPVSLLLAGCAAEPMGSEVYIAIGVEGVAAYEQQFNSSLGEEEPSEAHGIWNPLDSRDDVSLDTRMLSSPVEIVWVRDNKVVHADVVHPCLKEECSEVASPGAVDGMIQVSPGAFGEIEDGSEVRIGL